MSFEDFDATKNKKERFRRAVVVRQLDIDKKKAKSYKIPNGRAKLG
jgi:hypothetical protein